MANIKSEQIRSDLSLELDYDQPLSISNIMECLINLLGKENCNTEKVGNKKVLCYRHSEKTEVLILAAITYMGGNGQHPINKKRVQLKKWYKNIVNNYQHKQQHNVRFIGVYHYQNNIILADIIKETYLNKKMNSSAAHIYTNDLFQAMKEGLFKRTDKNKNTIISIKYTKFKDYLDGKMKEYSNELLTIFSLFNKEFNSCNWLTAKTAITEMYEAGWSKWKETEWPGWFLEYKLDTFIETFHLENKIIYTGSFNKKIGDLDFDLWFDENKFYGDLKASDITKKQAPGNDQGNFIECINKYDKFWYVIYEHETIKDNIENNYEATRFRTNYIKSKNEWPKKKVWNELSYHSRMKNSVKFKKMCIIELNRINFREVLNDFNQGHQPNGNKRRIKFKITKNNIDNFIIFEQNFVKLNDK